jgi:hypothetical protein
VDVVPAGDICSEVSNMGIVPGGHTVGSVAELLRRFEDARGDLRLHEISRSWI